MKNTCHCLNSCLLNSFVCCWQKIVSASRFVVNCWLNWWIGNWCKNACKSNLSAIDWVCVHQQLQIGLFFCKFTARALEKWFWLSHRSMLLLAGILKCYIKVAYITSSFISRVMEHDKKIYERVCLMRGLCTKINIKNLNTFFSCSVNRKHRQNSTLFYLHFQSERWGLFFASTVKTDGSSKKPFILYISFMHNIIFRMHEHLIITHTWNVESRRVKRKKEEKSWINNKINQKINLKSFLLVRSWKL